MFTRTERRRLRRGRTVDISGKRYALCRDCRKVVRLNKPVLGSVHVCVPEDRTRQERRPQ